MGITRPREPIGIEKLDQILHGGFIRGKTYLIAGETGTGKTIFAMQFLLHGARMLDQPGLYVSGDEDIESLIEGLREFGWSIDELIDRGKINFLSLVSEFPDKFDSKALKIGVKSLVERIERWSKEYGVKRLVLDPIAPFIIGEERLNWIREYVRRLITEIERRIGCTTIMTSEIPTGSNALSRYGIEEFLASGVIILRIEKSIRGYRRVMVIRKMRWTPVKPVELEFDIVPGKGIVITEF